MIYEVEYEIPWTLEHVIGGIIFSAEAVVCVEVDVDRGGDVARWNAVAIGTRDARNRWVEAHDTTGVLASILADIQADEGGGFDRAVSEKIADDDHAPKPRCERAEHGTYYRGGSL